MSVSAALKLQQAGFDDRQIEALDALVSGEAATKVDLVEAKAELKAEIVSVRHDVTQVKQLALLIAGGIIALFVRSFFG